MFCYETTQNSEITICQALGCSTDCALGLLSYFDILYTAEVQHHLNFLIILAF